MTAVAEPQRPAAEASRDDALAPAAGLQLHGELHGSGYREGAALVRRADGQMVQLGPLMYALLANLDGKRGLDELAAVMSEQLGRRFDREHVVRLAEKLAEQGLLAGFEHKAPPRRNPLLALRWKVLVTNPTVTKRLTAPFTVLFRPWIMWPVLVAFAGVVWFVLVQKGIASATAQAFHKPELLLLVFALGVLSAGFHELGHAAACRYGGATPGGMGCGIYMVWPAFYTDVTDAYRLPKRDRLRVDLGGLYFNTVVAVATMAVWLAIRVDALLLLIGLQLLLMVKQLSPIIRADGYHILADATGVPDLFSHMGPTLRRLLPWRRREPSALTGRARALVTFWVLLVVPILISLSVSAILLLPRLATSAWDSGSAIASGIPHELAAGQVVDLLASTVRLFALVLPALGTVLVTQRILRMLGAKATGWTGGRPMRRAVLVAATTLVLCGMAWAWWPAGQYQPILGNEGGTVAGIGRLLAAPQRIARPAATLAPVQLVPGKHLAVAMIPVGGATRQHPAVFVIKGEKGQKPVVLVTDNAPDPNGAPSLPPTTSSAPASTSASRTASAPASTTVDATTFPFQLPAKPGPHDTQALAVNTKDGGVKYTVAYSVITVGGGRPVDETNSAYAFASCNSCTTVAVSFQVVLIVGQTNTIAPINVAGALNANCPLCVTTAIADQIVVTLSAQPSKQLVDQLNRELEQLDLLPQLGAGGTPDQVAQVVAAVQQQVEQQLVASGLMTNPPQSGDSSGSQTGTGTTTMPSQSDTSTSTQTTPASGSTGTTTTPADTNTTTTPTDTTPTTTQPSPTGTSTTDTTTTGTTTDTSTSTTPTSSSP